MRLLVDWLIDWPRRIAGHLTWLAPLFVALAVAVGYQDIVSVANTTLNQTGQAIEAIALIMAVFLTISLSISLFMNWYNARLRLVER